MISIITLSYNAQDYTKKFVESIRKNTKLDYELIIVDNGSKKEIQAWVKEAGDKTILFKENQGFSAGFNAGLNIAIGDYVIFANNDTEFPPNWDNKLVEVFKIHSDAGIITPAYTSGRKSALRFTEGTKIKKIPPYGRYPSGVAFMMKRSFINDIGAWNEKYEIASGEDADLCFTVWKAGKEIYVDERVLIIHEGKVTSKNALPNWREHFKKNSRQFKNKWFYEYYFPLILRLKRKLFS